MKRSMAQDLPSQEASLKMSRHDPEDIQETETPTTNVFLIETVLRRLFKQIESVSMLKDLRRICQLWDELNTEELEERAFKGRLKPINLTFFNEVSREFKPIKASSLEMRGFLDDTSSNPRLYRSFTITFPCSLAVLNLHEFHWFYTEYSPTFLDLAIPGAFRCNKDNEGLLKELIRWAAPTLRELVINNIFAHESDKIPTRKSLSVQSLNFPHLRKVSTNICGFLNEGIVDAFKVIFTDFTNGNFPETPSLAFLKLRYGYPEYRLDLISNISHWTTLTMLEFKCDYTSRYHNLSPLVNGLLSLAQAGMTLKKLYLGLDFEKEKWEGEDEDPQFFRPFRNLSEFFASQAGSLEALKLSFNLKLNVRIYDDQELEGKIKILLPVFERLHTLSLNIDTRVCIDDIVINYNIFETDSNLHFPALENLTIFKFTGSLDSFFGSSYEEENEEDIGKNEEDMEEDVGENDDEDEEDVEEKEDGRLNLKRLAIPRGMFRGNEYNDHNLDNYFGSVEAVACLQASLKILRKFGDLVDTIQVFHIRDVDSMLDLSQFKGLKRVVIEEDDKLGKRRKLDENDIERYLGYFKKVAKLGLDSIKFRGLKIFGEEYKKFAEAFPFRVEFEEKPVDWFDEDFMNI